MSVIHSVYPIDETMASDLDDESIEYPIDAASRNPLVDDIKAAIATLEAYSVEYTNEVIGKRWQAEVKHKTDPENMAWALLTITKLQKGENAFFFENGWPDLILKIVIKIADKTGPLVLMSDADEMPFIVDPGADPKALLASWEAL